MKPPVARKLAVGHMCILTHVSNSQFSGYWWFQVLIISKCMNGQSTSMMLLLHSAFMLRVMKMLLKREAGGSAVNSHGNYIASHGKSWKNHWNGVFLISAGTLHDMPISTKFHVLLITIFFHFLVFKWVLPIALMSLDISIFKNFASPDVWCTMHATEQTRWSMRALTTSRLISSASPTR